MQSQQQRIEQDINLLITHLKPAASAQFKSNIKDYCRKLLNSVVSNRPNNQDPKILKQKIIEKVHSQGDNKKLIDCQQRINKIMLTNQVQKKGQIFKFLLKSSQFNNKGKNFSHIFQKDLDLNRTYQQTVNNVSMVSNANSYNESNMFMKPRKNVNLQQQISKIRERGSPSQQISENDIIKSILFSLQNIQSWLISYNNQTDSYSLYDNIQVSPTVRELVRYLTQIGWLFKKIRSSVPQRGSIWKTLHYAVEFQLGQYYKWTAFMQQTIRNKNCNIRKIIRWSYQPLQSLKWIAVVLQSVQSYNGCQIITCINGFRPHGEPRINDMLVRLLSHLVQPLLLFIHNWMYKGQLVDSYKQFFVKENTKINQYQQWSSRFTLDQANIPNILDKQSAIMIFNAGKTLNFLKNRCKCNYSISIPFIDPNKIINQEMYESSNILSLQFKKWLTAVYQNLSEKLLSQLRQKFNLKYHLQSMKHFYLMGKGDFIQHLIDTLKQEMSKPKHQIYQNTLDGYINDAITKSFQDFRIDIGIRQANQIEEQMMQNKNKIEEPKYQNQKLFMLKGSKMSKINSSKIDHTNSYRANIIDRLLSKKVDFGGQTAWDAFNFQYSMDKIEPLNSILSPQLVNNYQRIFQFLWKIKRIEHILKQIWVINQKQYPKSTMQKKFPQFFSILQRCHILRSSMSHFLNNFYGYLMIGIESAWDKFYKSLKLSKSLDQIIKQHRNLHNQLSNITFGSSNKKILHQSLMNVFKSIQQFKTVQTKILADYTEFYEKLRQYENRKKIMAKGILSMEQDELDIPHFDEADLLNRVRQVEDIYNKTFKTLYENLRKESEGGVLVFRLDFSEYYAMKQIQNQ